MKNYFACMSHLFRLDLDSMFMSESGRFMFAWKKSIEHGCMACLNNSPASGQSSMCLSVRTFLQVHRIFVI